MGSGGQSHAPAASTPGKDPVAIVQGLRAGLDRCGKSRPHRAFIADRPARSQSKYFFYTP